MFNVQCSKLRLSERRAKLARAIPSVSNLERSSMFNEEETGGISLADVIEAFYDCLKRKRNTLNALEFEMDFERNCLDL